MTDGTPSHGATSSRGTASRTGGEDTAATEHPRNEERTGFYLTVGFGF